MSTGQIHDLGYKRYAGSRRSVGTRWRVIMRHQIAQSWRTWWRFKLWLIAASLATAIAAGFLYFASSQVIRMFGGLSGQLVKLADGILPLSTVWDTPIAFVVSLTISATVVAGDAQSGAFIFYFARSLRPRDYVLGKLVGLGLLVALIMAGGPLLLAALRLGLSDNLEQLIAMLPLLLKALAVGALGTLIYTAVPLGMSALVARRWHAIALWASYYLLIGNLARALGRATEPAIAALSLPGSLAAVSYDLFNVQLIERGAVAIPVRAALVSILAHAAVAIGLVFWRVRRAQQTGVGGAS